MTGRRVPERSQVSPGGRVARTDWVSVPPHSSPRRSSDARARTRPHGTGPDPGSRGSAAGMRRQGTRWTARLRRRTASARPDPAGRRAGHGLRRPAAGRRPGRGRTGPRHALDQPQRPDPRRRRSPSPTPTARRSARSRPTTDGQWSVDLPGDGPVRGHARRRRPARRRARWAPAGQPHRHRRTRAARSRSTSGSSDGTTRQRRRRRPGGSSSSSSTGCASGC